MKKLVSTLLLFCFYGAYSQTNGANIDEKYLEDQFYLGVTYNFILDKPQDVTQRNLSYGLQVGMIKDIPLNRERNIGLGFGLGYGVNSYYSNIISSESDDKLTYSLTTDDLGVKRSKIEIHQVEFPVEFRWRNSNTEEFKFWRVYTGLKFAYAFAARNKVVDQDNTYSFSNPDIKKFQYGLMLNVGYNTFNIHIYYALDKLLNDDAILDGEQINLKPLRVGLIFYIL